LGREGKGGLRVTLSVLGQAFKCAAPELLKTDKPTEPDTRKKGSAKVVKDIKSVKDLKAGKKKKWISCFEKLRCAIAPVFA
jgi:hypothetical protein